MSGAKVFCLRRFFATVVRDLKEKGISIIIIAHNYGQVFPVCDRVNLLQSGKITFDKYSQDTSVEERPR